MAATYGKSLPASVQHLVHSGERLADVPLAPHFAPASSAVPAFRRDASSSASSSTQTAGFDFDAFQQAQDAQLGRSHLDRVWKGATASTPDRHFAASSPTQSSASRSTVQDGAELASLLKGGSLLDAVDGDWENELLARQNEPWRVELESRMPFDPFATSMAARKGKGRASDGPEYERAGDMSPTSTELLSSLSSLDLADKAYLRTLLAQDPAMVFDDYFSRGSYTDDVYGLPPAVQRLFEKAAQRDERAGVEEGRRKAVRRLGMVLQHMRATASDPRVAGEPVVAFASVAGTEPQRGQGTLRSGQDSVLRQQPITSTHAHYARNLGLSSSVYQPAEQHHVQQLAQASSTSSGYGNYTVPSSLSESAFITITPPPSSPSAPFMPPAAHRDAGRDVEIDTPAPSTARLLERHMVRVRSNSEGRFGPAFSRSPSPDGGNSPSLEATPVDAGLRGASPLEMGSSYDVKEGRTH